MANLLMIDDNPQNQTYLSRIIRLRTDHEFAVAGSGPEGIEKIVIEGESFEAFNTSGGCATMCETYDGKVENLDYKTMRYPGHAELMNFFFHELLDFLKLARSHKRAHIGFVKALDKHPARFGFGRFSQERQLLQVLFELFATLVPGGESDEDARFGGVGGGQGVALVFHHSRNFSMYTAIPRMVAMSNMSR